MQLRNDVILVPSPCHLVENNRPSCMYHRTVEDCEDFVYGARESFRRVFTVNCSMKTTLKKPMPRKMHGSSYAAILVNCYFYPVSTLALVNRRGNHRIVYTTSSRHFPFFKAYSVDPARISEADPQWLRILGVLRPRGRRKVPTHSPW